jgi:peptidoglycan L-alanyl-D-glutamate endopeptidase CwlK
MESKVNKLDSLEPEFREKIIKLIAELAVHGIVCVVTSGRRTISEQYKLYQQGRTTPGKIVTKAKGGQSPHNFGLAADLCPLHPETKELWWDAPDDIWNVIHSLAEDGSLTDLDSGYDWKFCDRPHVEDKSWKQAQALWMEGKLSVA